MLRRVGPGECGSRKTEISHHTRARAHLTANSYRRSMYIHCVCIYREKFSGCAAVSFSFLNHLLLSPSSFILLLRLPRTIVVRFPSHRHQSIVLIVVIIHTATRRGEEDFCVCVCVCLTMKTLSSSFRGPNIGAQKALQEMSSNQMMITLHFSFSFFLSFGAPW